MWRLFLFFLFHFVLFGRQTQATSELPVLYNKSFISSAKIDFTGIFLKGYSEVRWDRNGDGKIDEWLVTSGQMRSTISFLNGQPQILVIEKRVSKGKIYIQFRFHKPGQARLVSSHFSPFKVYFNNDLFSEADDLCPQDSLVTILGAKHLRKLMSETKNLDWESKIKGMIDPSCKAEMQSGNYRQLESAVMKYFKIDFEGSVESNTYLNCIARNSATSELLPHLVDSIIRAPIEAPPLKISCANIKASGCSKASFDDKSQNIQIQVTNPACRKDMSSIFEEHIFHENLHRIGQERQSESFVQTVTKACVGSGSLPISIDEPKLDWEAVQGYHDSPTATSAAVKESSQSQVTNIPSDVATAKVESVAVSTEANSSLDSGFQRVDSSSVVSNLQAIAYSRARTAPVIALADSVLRNAIVQPAFAKSRAGDTTPKRSVSSVSSSAAKIGGGQLESPQSSKPSKDETLLPPEPKGAREAVVGSVGKAKVASKSKSTPSQQRAPASGGGSGGVDLSTSGAFQKGSAAAPVAVGSDPLVQRLTKMPARQLWQYIQKNEQILKKRRILILDSKNRIWGEQDPDKAAYRLREYNQRLIPESQ